MSLPSVNDLLPLAFALRIVCTFAPNKIFLGLHVVMVLVLYKLHVLTVLACFSKQ